MRRRGRRRNEVHRRPRPVDRPVHPVQRPGLFTYIAAYLVSDDERIDDGYDPAPSVERFGRPHGEPSEIHRPRQSRANSSSATRNAAPNSPALSPSGEVLMRRSRVAKAIERPYTVRRSSPRKASSAALICPPMTMSEGL